jgi:hypothetical protein
MPCHLATSALSYGSVTCHVIPCHVIVWSPRQMLTSSVPRVTLPVVTRVTSNRSIRTPKCPKLPTTCHYLRLPCVTCMDLPRVIYTDMPRQHPYGLYGLHSQQFFFACLTFRTECDIFSIRTPFDKVNIPLESGRRDGRNGIGFVAF